MKTSKTKTAGLQVKTSVKAGGLGNGNHSRRMTGLKVLTSVKAGGLGNGNHSRALVG